MKQIDNVLFRLLKIYISLKVIYFLILFYFICIGITTENINKKIKKIIGLSCVLLKLFKTPFYRSCKICSNFFVFFSFLEKLPLLLLSYGSGCINIRCCRLHATVIQLFSRDEFNGRRIDAITFTGWLGPILKNMTHVSVTTGAAYLCAYAFWVFN